jgi:exosortase D (VPLPA-CTERM-specific)
MNPSAVNLKNLWKPLLIAAALTFLYANALFKLALDWWTDENYSHGLLVPFVIGFIVWTEFDRLKKLAGEPKFLFGAGIILSAIALLFAGTLGAELFAQRVSFVLMLVGVVVYFFGTKILQILVVPLALLLLAVPIPQIIFNKIAFPLQIWASQAAVWGVRLLSVPTLRKGNVIEILPEGATQIIALEVVEACSGIRSLMTLVTLALVLAYFTNEKSDASEESWISHIKSFDFWRAVILMFSAIPIAVLTNAARVTATGVLTYYYGKQATENTWHDASGWLVYVFALGLLIALNFVLKKLRRKRSGEKEKNEIEGWKFESETVRRQNNAINNNIHAEKVSSTSLLVYSFSFLIAFLLASGVLINWFEQRGETEIARQPLSELSASLGDWRQKGDAIRFREQTESVLRVSDYTMREYVAPNGRMANLYVGYYASQRTGATYHSPQNCLPGAGWVMREPESIEIKTASGKSFQANLYRLENGVYREVMIYWYQGRGRFEASEYADKINTIWDGVLRRRSDGALVRVMTSVGGDEKAAIDAAADLSARLSEGLAAFVPE